MGEALAHAWRSELAAAPRFLGAMAAVRLPLGAGGDRLRGRRLATRLVEEHGITCGVLVLDGGLWVRVSAQVYNAPGDYQRLASIGASLKP